MYYYKLYDWTLKSDREIDYLEKQNVSTKNNYLEIQLADIEKINFLSKKLILDKSEENIIIFETNLGYLINYYNNTIIVSSKFIYFQIGQDYEIQMEIFLTLGLTLLFVDRNIIPFHGAAILIEDSIFIISAKSNTGKSTLLLNLLLKGYKLCADDLIPIEISEKGCFGIQSNCSFVKLWDDTIEKYNIKNLRKEIIYKTGKYRVLFKDNLVDEIQSYVKIREIIILNTNFDGEGVITEELNGLKKLVNIFELTHGTLLLKDLLNKKLFNKHMLLKNNIKVTEWKYKKNYKNLDILIDMISERSKNAINI